MTNTLNKPPARFYLPQLDGLRFIAFFLVFLHHIPTAIGYFAPKSVMHFVMLKLSTFG